MEAKICENRGFVLFPWDYFQMRLAAVTVFTVVWSLSTGGK